jgi:hypothetical protein
MTDARSGSSRKSPSGMTQSRPLRGGNENPVRRNGAALQGNETRTSDDETSLLSDVTDGQ